MDIVPAPFPAHQDDTDLGQALSVVGEPSRRIQGMVRGYVGYADRFTGVSRQLEIPTGDVVMIVGLGSALRVIDPHHANRSVVHQDGFLAGLHDGPVMTEAIGGSCGVQVILTPVGARRLLGLGFPMDSLANRAVGLEDLLGETGRRMVQRVREAPNWAARFRVLDEVITASVVEGEPPAPEIVWAWRQLTLSGGMIPIGSLATELGWSQKRLIAGFRETVGLPPKVFAQVTRFQRAVRLIECSPRPRWAEVADACGYVDQSHLIRAFQRFAGSSPGAYLDRRLPDRRDTVGT